MKKFISIAWLIIIAICLSYFFYHPDEFKPDSIALFFSQFEKQALILYLIVSLLRGLTLIPGTPFVIAGTLMFQDKALVLVISLLGMLFSSSMIYFFSDFLGFKKYFDKHNGKIEELKEKLDRPSGFIFVLVWSLFPLTPSDLISYVAGITKMKYSKFISSLFLGELIICSVYVYSIKLFQF